jgi:hypothetical protein
MKTFLNTPYFINLKTIFVAMIMLFSMTLATAQLDEQNILAYVNISKAELTKTPNELNLSFSVYNRKGIQSEINTYLNLTKDGQNIILPVDMTFSLNENQDKNVTKKIIIPPYLNGEYRVELNMQTKAGMPLSFYDLGKVSFSNNLGKETVLNNCVLTAGGNYFDLRQGPDIDRNASLELVCSDNKFFDNIRPVSKVTKRTQLGDVVKDNVTNAFAKRDGKYFIKLDTDLPPQAYDSAVTFLDANNKVVPIAPIYAHYVIRGNSATIQGSQLDKNSYKKDEVANVTVLTSGRADSFDGAAVQGDTESNVKAVVKVMSGSIMCGEQATDINIASDINKKLVAVKVVADCPKAVASTELFSNNQSLAISTTAELENKTVSNVEYGDLKSFEYDNSVDLLNKKSSTTSTLEYIGILAALVMLGGASLYFFRKHDLAKNG